MSTPGHHAVGDGVHRHGQVPRVGSRQESTRWKRRHAPHGMSHARCPGLEHDNQRGGPTRYTSTKSAEKCTGTSEPRHARLQGTCAASLATIAGMLQATGGQHRRRRGKRSLETRITITIQITLSRPGSNTGVRLREHMGAHVDTDPRPSAACCGLTTGRSKPAISHFLVRPFPFPFPFPPPPSTLALHPRSLCQSLPTLTPQSPSGPPPPPAGRSGSSACPICCLSDSPDGSPRRRP